MSRNILLTKIDSDYAEHHITSKSQTSAILIELLMSHSARRVVIYGKGQTSILDSYYPQ